MTAEFVAVLVVLLAPALLFLGWLALIGTVVAALGASSDRELDELRLLSPRPARPDHLAGATGSAGEPDRTAIAAASTRFATPSLPMMFETWTLAVLSLMKSVSAIRRFV